jgi:hypothetical protein
MTRYVEYRTTDGGTIMVEVEEEKEPVETAIVNAGITDKAVERVVQARDTFEGAMMDAVRRNAQAFIETMDELSKSPDEAELIFGLKATAEGDAAVVKIGAEATYGVKLTWKRETAE